ncbi:MAG: hypothetical protein D6814_01825 [Calditrichaeota bacterium]|nr:MAG: hypothetical protein D6814_01825 [Calditrichota bacterium]
MTWKKLSYFSLLLVPIAVIACASTSQNINKKAFRQALSKPVEAWTLEECEAVIHRYTVTSQRWGPAVASEFGQGGKSIYIRAMPFTREVVKAIVRKEAIQRRFSLQQFYQRLKEDLESFTNFTVDPQSHKIIKKSPDAQNYLNEYTFQVYFSNISDPYRTIYVYRAEEGFFLQRDDGKFTRVIDFSGTDSDPYFTLYNDIYTMVTFSAFTDNGERLEFNEKTIPHFKLVFTSFQKEPIELKWAEMK